MAAIAAVLLVFVAPQLEKLGLTITSAELQTAIVVTIAYLVGQGIADNGKEAAKIVTKPVPPSAVLPPLPPSPGA